MTIENQAETSGFAALGITGALLKGVIQAGFTEPKPIQAKAIPPQIEGRDVLGIAQTGSGKTAAFSLPIISKIVGLGTKRLPKTTRALILVPTRELAVQIEETIRLVSKNLHLSTALVLGGVSRSSQVRKLAPGVDILIATPGRLMDLIREKDLSLGQTHWLVLDEADRMLDMGFINDVRRIAKATPTNRQTALFSATMPKEIEELAGGVLKDPIRVEVAPQGTTAAEIEQGVILARVKQKRKLLSEMLANPEIKSALIFSRTKHGADRVARDLERDGFAAAVIHGNKSQNARQKALNGFRDGSTRILVATDIAARGIDVPGISHVINFDLPDEAESYVHRIGRTGRNGATGTAITLCAPDEADKLRAVERVIRKKLTITADHRDEPDPQPSAADRAANAAERSRPEGARPAQPHGKGKPRQAFGGKPHGKPHGHAAAKPFAGNPVGDGERSSRPAGPKRFRPRRAPRRAA